MELLQAREVGHSGSVDFILASLCGLSECRNRTDKHIRQNCRKNRWLAVSRWLCSYCVAPLLMTSVLFHPVLGLFKTCDSNWDKTLKKLPSCFLPWAQFKQPWNIKKTQLFFHLYLDHSKYSHIYYKFALGTEPSQVVLPSRNYTLDVYTKTKYNCPLSFHHVPPLLNDCCSTVLASGYAAHSGISQ